MKKAPAPEAWGKSIWRQIEPIIKRLSVRRFDTRLGFALLLAGISPIIIFTAIFYYHITVALQEEEQKATLAAAQSFASAFQRKRTELLRQVQDYAMWDEMYYHAQFPDPRWFQENLTTWVPEQFNISLILLTNSAGKVLTQAGPSQFSVPSSPSTLATLGTWVQLMDNHPFMIAASPVLPTNRNGPPRGLLFFGKEIDENMLRELFPFPDSKTALIIVSPGVPIKAIGNPEVLPEVTTLEKWLQEQNAPHFATINNAPVLWFPVEDNNISSLFLIASLSKANTLLVRSHLVKSLAITSLLASLLLIALGIFLYRQVVNPLSQLRNFLLAQTYWSSQHSEEKISCAAPAEIEEFSRQIAATFRLHHHHATVDALTGLFNRRYFEERLAQELKTATENNQPLSIIMLDLDQFKRFNDRYGHLVGDEVLRQVAAVLKSSVRANDFVARYGGDEIIIVLPQTTHSAALEISKRLAEKVSTLSFPSCTTGPPILFPPGASETFAETLRVTVSIGIATYPLHGETPRELIAHADKEMLQHKQRLANPSYLN